MVRQAREKGYWLPFYEHCSLVTNSMAELTIHDSHITMLTHASD